MTTDDDVLRMFAEADPARRPDRFDQTVDGADYLAELSERSMTMTLTDSTQTTVSPTRRWAWAGAAAAVVVFVGALALFVRGGDQPDDAQSTEGTASAADIDTVHRFISAVNDRDLTTVEQLSNDALAIDGGGLTVDAALGAEEMASLMAWYDAFDWRWEDAVCAASSPGAGVGCELFERNRLTDLTGAERPATVSFTMVDGAVGAVHVDADLSDYSEIAFNRFKGWVRTNHPDDVARMWGVASRPVLGAESATLFERHLDDFAKFWVADRFIEAVNDRDLTAIGDVSADQFTFESELTAESLAVEELASLMAWYDAFDWRWDDVTCETSAADVRCELMERNRLTDLTGAERPAIVMFTVVGDEVGSVTVGADLVAYSENAYEPFRDWVRNNHPDDVARLWNETSQPVLTAEAAALFDRHLTGFAADATTSTDG